MADKKNNFEKDINVPSKEQTNDSLKNQDKNFNESCAHEKEQITCDCKYCMENPTCFKELLEEQLARKTQECEKLKEDYAELEQERERLKSYGATLLADKNAMEIGRDDYIQRCKQLEQECEEMKKANQHIDTNRQCKGSKLKRIEDLISACETGYTDEFIQKIYGIIQEPEPTINDYSIIDRYRKALEEIEQELKEDIYCESQECGCDDSEECLRCTKDLILDIINKAKGGEDERK